MKPPLKLCQLSFLSMGVSLAFLLGSQPLSAADESFFRENFTSGVGGAQPYRGGEVLESVRDETGPYLKATLPGVGTLEGIRIALPAIDGDRLMTVRAKVRGNGRFGPMIQAANGWTRLPEMALSNEWREIVVPKTLNRGRSPSTFYLLTLPLDQVQANAYIEIAEIEATASEPLSLPDHDVQPQRFSGADHVAPALQREFEGQRVGFSDRPFVTEELPFPQTSRPIEFHLHVYASGDADRFQICSRRGDVKQVIREVTSTGRGWHWLQFSPITAGEAGEGITVEVWPKGEAALGAIVLSSEVGLNPEDTR